MLNDHTHWHLCAAEVSLNSYLKKHVLPRQLTLTFSKMWVSNLHALAVSWTGLKLVSHACVMFWRTQQCICLHGSTADDVEFEQLTCDRQPWTHILCIGHLTTCPWTRMPLPLRICLRTAHPRHKHQLDWRKMWWNPRPVPLRESSQRPLEIRTDVMEEKLLVSREKNLQAGRVPKHFSGLCFLCASVSRCLYRACYVHEESRSICPEKRCGPRMWILAEIFGKCPSTTTTFALLNVFRDLRPPKQ